MLWMGLGFVGLAASGARRGRGAAGDWLLEPVKTLSELHGDPAGGTVSLENGLARRRFTTTPNWATLSLRHGVAGGEVVRAVEPEAVITVAGRRWEVGGLKGQPDHSYLDPGWVGRLEGASNAFRYVRHRTGVPEARYPWHPRFGAPEAPWPPRGVHLEVDFEPPGAAGVPAEVTGLRITVHYELYDGLPAMAKWVTVSNAGPASVVVEGLEVERLAVAPDQRARLLVETDQIHVGAPRWSADPAWPTFAPINPGDARHIPHPQEYLLRCDYNPGPGAALGAGERFESFRALEMLLDNEDRERSGLTYRKVYRTLTPQATENPIFMHLRNSDSVSIRRAVDQCVAVGFEMVILTFWSGFNMESEDPAYIARIKADFDYAHSRGIRIGGYILFCTTASKGPLNDAIDPATGKPDGSLCLGAEYTDGYFAKLLRFIDATGMDVIETDGPYHGYDCTSTKHKYHRGLADSHWVQWQRQTMFYKACRDRGLYINSPDWYFFQGSNKYPMGYREENWSLPRELQIIIGRQNIYDGTWNKTPSMGWMMLPLTEYHGGGAAATLEPLEQHLDAYESHLAQNFGAGVIACYRGPRLFDSDRTREVVARWTSFYKQHRAILDSDIIHVRRADGRDIDCMLHVNPGLPTRGLAMVYNPLDQTVTRTLVLPLHYAGLRGSARVRWEEGSWRRVALDDEARARVEVRLGPRAAGWFVIEPAR
jgi:hypothetical protein